MADISPLPPTLHKWKLKYPGAAMNDLKKHGTPPLDNGIIPLLSAGDNGRTMLRDDEGRNTNQNFTTQNDICC